LIAHVGRPATRRDELDFNIIRLADHIPGLCAPRAARPAASQGPAIKFASPNVFQPCDFSHVGLHRTAGYILGVDPTEVPPHISFGDGSRPIPEPNVCIAVQSTTQCKHWNNPDGWREV